MPFYDYYCEDNGRTVEVFHPLKTRLKTWGDICRKTGIEPGKTPPEAPVIRLIGGVTPAVFRLKGLDKDDYGDKLEI